MTEPVARDPETVQRILRERADALARPLDAEDHSEMMGTVGLAVGGERYAIELRHVAGVEHVVKVTPLPGTPRFWAGLANVHGAVRPILDLREYLQVDAAADAVPPATIVVVAASGTMVGLLCDDASDVTWIPRRDIAPPLPSSRPGGPVLSGIMPDLAGVLNLEALLADPALVVDDLDAVVTRLRSHGAPIETIDVQVPGRRRLYCRDPLGHVIELIQFL